ncbi:MAG TPA: NINE protein [Spirochaetales bacterium]|nr:NINE protein [Spirochaetales bacterium]
MVKAPPAAFFLGAVLWYYIPIRIMENAMYYNTATAYLLWALGGFGALGFHRFYLRKIPTGILWLCTGGLGMVGSVYDFFTLSGQVREANIRAGYREALDMPRERVVIRERYVEPGQDRSRAKDTIEKVILRTAKKNGGLVTPGEIAIESDYDSESARTALEKLAAKGFCEMRVRPSGVIVYRFPEFAAGDEGFEPGI